MAADRAEIGVFGGSGFNCFLENVERFFASNISRVRDLILRMIPLIPIERDWPCATAMKGAVIGG